MAETTIFEPGGYRYVRGRFQYSGGVMAEPGFAIERARFARPVPLDEGFRRIETYLDALGRPPTAFCACELRSPGQFTDEGFVAFNRVYVGTLEGWGIFKDDDNPVARSNVCPEVNPPPEPSFHAFSYTVPAAAGDAAGPKSFVIAGSGEAPEGPGGYGERIIRLGRHLARRHAGKGAVRARSVGASDGGVGPHLGGRHHEPGLHGPRNPRVSRRRGGPPGCGAGRRDVDLRPAAGPGTGIRNPEDVRSVPVERVIG